MTQTEINVQALKTGYEAGVARAAQMVPGAKFVGSMPEAVAAGFANGSLAYEGFQIGFLGALAQPITTDADGVIA